MSDQEIERKINKINANMSLEGMPLTEELKSTLRNCFNGKSSFEKEILKLKKECKEVYG
ncbi:MAG: hypothetical protein LBL91_01410 [Lachnospiraceae bacterium]|jgi:hypothetical protein|nr:hypothetical protein [Lachnospiraceae bacterium]